MKTYIILLTNNYVLMSKTKPKKKGNYLKEVRLFELKGDVPFQNVVEWQENDYSHAGIKEVDDWE